MTQKPVFAVIGSGMQGTAEAYDLAVSANAAAIIMADQDEHRARLAARRINSLTGRQAAVPVQLNAASEADVTTMLLAHRVTVCCAAAHYALNHSLTKASIQAGAHFCDMGGNTDVVLKQHDMDTDARSKGVAIMPDCGIAPGTANILAARAIRHIDCRSIRMYCGGLPQRRDLPLGYRLVFSVAGLTNEYTGTCTEIRNGQIVEQPAFTEKEEVILPEPVGRCEAFLTSGGTSTGPLSFLGKVDEYGYKTVRYSGHFDRIRAMIDMGFLDTTPVVTKAGPVVPRDLFHVLASRFWDCPDELDLLVLRVIAQGRNEDGQAVEMVQDIMDFQDPASGLTAMERTTAFSTAIIAKALAEGVFEPGVHFLERSVDPDWFVVELAKRGIGCTTVMHPVHSS